MTFDPTKPVQTRDGRPARIICTDRITDMEGAIIALISCGAVEAVWTYNQNGIVSYNQGHETKNDLVNVPVRTSTWENVYKSVSGAAAYRTKQIADEGCIRYDTGKWGPRIGYLRRDFEDGVFVSAEFEPLTSEE